MKVEMESNKSVKRIETIEGTRASFKAPKISSLKKTLLKSGRLKICEGVLTRPRVQAIMVTVAIARIKAKGFFLDIRNDATAIPRIVNSAGFPSAPSLTKVTGSATTKPAFFKPIKV